MALVDKPAEGSASEVVAPVSDIPEQFQGKEFADVVKMYQSLEKKFGEQSNEVGQLRSLAEQQIMSPASSESVSEDIDFYSDPESAVERLIDRKLKPYAEIATQQTQAAVQQKLNQEFPNWRETVADEGFQEWVGKSKVRADLFVKADSADYDAAAELFSTWSELNEVKGAKTQAAKAAVDRDRKLRAATTEKGSAGIDPRKILNRADLRNLKQTNPSRYRELEPDIMKAYSEGRVR
jgi:hypothetical protein